MNPVELQITAAALDGRPQRLVSLGHANGKAFRDNLNTDSDTARRRFIRRAARTFDAQEDELQWLHGAIVEAADEADAEADVAVSAGDGEERKNQATQLVGLAHEAELFHDPAGDALTRFPVDKHWEVCRLNHRLFKRWLARFFYVSAGKTASAQAMQDALGVLEAKAVFEGRERSVHVRVAGRDGNIYLDLANEGWEVIEISATGWRLVAESPVMFRRAKAMLPLPTPVHGGRVDELRQFVHLGDDEWTLLVAWLVAALRPSGPYPVLNVHGEHGSGKSTVCRMTRALVDPNMSPLRCEPRDARDLMIAANNGGVIALDNLSHLQPWLSDCLCRLSTGGGFSTRTLFENDQETVFDAQRPVIINGIDDVATRADLLDRCLLLNLPRIEQAQRRSEAAIWAGFRAARPRILGGLLSAVSAALRNLASTHLPSLPRMADFALWVTAAEPELGWEPGRLLVAYTRNQEDGNQMALDASPVGKAVTEFVEQVREWSGTMTELLGELDRRADQKTMSLTSWPKSAAALGTAVKRLAPNLRNSGIGVTETRLGKRRRRVVTLTWRPERDGEMPSALSALSATAESAAHVEAVADRAGSRPPEADRPASAGTGVFPAETGRADRADGADSILRGCSSGSLSTSAGVPAPTTRPADPVPESRFIGGAEREVSEAVSP